MKLVCIAFILLLLISVYAKKSGTCGTGCQWTLDDEGTLTINGNGEMDDCKSVNSAPWYSSRDSIKKVVIEEITYIGHYAFYECTSLTAITIPEQVTSIGRSAFSGCTSLTAINVSERNTEYESNNSVLFTKGKATLVKYPAGKKEDKYDIP